MAGEEPVTSPDQHKPTVSRRAALFGAVVTIGALVLMALFGNHAGRVEEVYLYGIAGLIALVIIIDFALRKSGLRSDD